MSHPGEFTVCADCGAPVEEASDTPVGLRVPCVSCESTKRLFQVNVKESLTFREKLGMKLKRPGYKKPVFESVGGYDLHRKSGQWNHLTREIDRENNRYKERITNPQTGEVIRDVDELLTDHVNRGSARPKNGAGDA